MTFLPAILLAAAAFAVAVLALRLPRAGWTLTASALLFGLAGYALQGSPGQPGAPHGPAAPVDAAAGETLVEARRAMFGPMPAQPLVTTADAFARRGQFGDAAGVLRGVIAKAPRDPEAWLALANAITGHADGRLTPAAVYAYERAATLDPGNPAAALFLGVALIREGRPGQARTLWAQLLADAPADAPWRAGMADRLARLDLLIAQAGSR